MTYCSKNGRIEIAAYRAYRSVNGVALYIMPFIRPPKNLRWLLMTEENWTRLSKQAALGAIQIVGVFRTTDSCSTPAAIAEAMQEALCSSGLEGRE